MVHVQGTRPIVIEQMQAHKQSVRSLLQGIIPQQGFSLGNCVTVFAQILQQQNHLLARAEEAGAQAFPMGKNPVVVATGQQITVVLCKSLFERMSLCVGMGYLFGPS
ncbi:hypothetical protein D6833_01880 [Candidatus Parcubacteria bacterium]|nr:MAG: hypothetical protein D6833_01880 [Candidatus Parcubacteria bacterium]